LQTSVSDPGSPHDLHAPAAHTMDGPAHSPASVHAHAAVPGAHALFLSNASHVRVDAPASSQCAHSHVVPGHAEHAGKHAPVCRQKKSVAPPSHTSHGAPVRQKDSPGHVK
jgi:hypothetical protein